MALHTSRHNRHSIRTRPPHARGQTNGMWLDRTPRTTTPPVNHDPTCLSPVLACLQSSNTLLVGGKPACTQERCSAQDESTESCSCHCRRVCRGQCRRAKLDQHQSQCSERKPLCGKHSMAVPIAQAFGTTTAHGTHRCSSLLYPSARSTSAASWFCRLTAAPSSSLMIASAVLSCCASWRAEASCWLDSWLACASCRLDSWDCRQQSSDSSDSVDSEHNCELKVHGIKKQASDHQCADQLGKAY